MDLIDVKIRLGLMGRLVYIFGNGGSRLFASSDAGCFPLKAPPDPELSPLSLLSAASWHFVDGLQWSMFNCVGKNAKSCVKFCPVFSLLCFTYIWHSSLLIKEGGLLIFLINYLLS